MDAGRISELSRRVASAASRRQALGVMAGTAAAGLLGRAAPGAAAEVDLAGVPIVNCKMPGFNCRRDTNCCSRHCNKGVCSCSRKGRACWQPLEGALCCSGRCRNGRCK